MVVSLVKVKVTVEDRQVQHIFESNATSAALAPNCTGDITLKNVLDLSVLHSYLNQINNETLTLNPKSGCDTSNKSYKLTICQNNSL